MPKQPDDVGPSSKDTAPKTLGAVCIHGKQRSSRSGVQAALEGGLVFKGRAKGERRDKANGVIPKTAIKCSGNLLSHSQTEPFRIVGHE